MSFLVTLYHDRLAGTINSRVLSPSSFRQPSEGADGESEFAEDGASEQDQLMSEDDGDGGGGDVKVAETNIVLDCH